MLKTYQNEIGSGNSFWAGILAFGARIQVVIRLHGLHRQRRWVFFQGRIGVRVCTFLSVSFANTDTRRAVSPLTHFCRACVRDANDAASAFAIDSLVSHFRPNDSEGDQLARAAA